jgi:hypothetical protein
MKMLKNVAPRVLVGALVALALAGPLPAGKTGVRRFTARDLKPDFGADGNAAFGRPAAVAHDAAAIYVVDAEAHEIRIFSKLGALLRVVGRQGQGPGEFNMPADVDVRDGRVYVADKLNGRVQVLDPDGLPIGGFRVPFGPDQVCALAGGKIALSHLPTAMKGSEPMIHCYSGNGKLLWEAMASRTTEDLTYDAFRNLLVMARDGEDALCVVRKSDEDAVRRFDGLGRALAPFAVPRSYPVRKVALPLRGPRKVIEAFCWDAAFDAGRVGILAPGYAEDSDVGPGDRIYLFGPAAGAVAVVDLPAPVRRIDLDGDGIYAVDENNDLRILRMEPR